MAETADDLDIKIEDDPVETPIEGAPEGDKKVIEPEEGIEALKKQLADEKAEKEREKASRLAAEAEARRHAEAATAAKTEVQDTNVQLVTNAISTLKQGQDVAKKAYAEAMAAQDFEAAAEAQLQMAENAAKLHALETGLEQLKAAPKPKAEVQTDAVEMLASQLTPKSAAWVRAHPECATNPRQYQRMLAAHNLAVTDGLEPESPEYFASIEKTMGFGSTDAAPQESALSEAAAPSARRQSPPAAPVGRGAGSNSSTTIRLTAEQREIAEMNGLTPEEYAKNLRELQREGRVH